MFACTLNDRIFSLYFVATNFEFIKNRTFVSEQLGAMCYKTFSV